MARVGTMLERCVPMTREHPRGSDETIVRTGAVQVYHWKARVGVGVPRQAPGAEEIARPTRGEIVASAGRLLAVGMIPTEVDDACQRVVEPSSLDAVTLASTYEPTSSGVIVYLDVYTPVEMQPAGKVDEAATGLMQRYQR